jgi:hypothetical protein
MMILKQNYELIKEQSNLSKDNTELKQLMLEIVKNGTNIGVVTPLPQLNSRL